MRALRSPGIGALILACLVALALAGALPGGAQSQKSAAPDDVLNGTNRLADRT